MSRLGRLGELNLWRRPGFLGLGDGATSEPARSTREQVGIVILFLNQLLLLLLLRGERSLLLLWLLLLLW